MHAETTPTNPSSPYEPYFVVARAATRRLCAVRAGIASAPKLGGLMFVLALRVSSLALLIVTCALVACTSANSGSASSGGAGGGALAAQSCVYENRSVQHCGGATPGPWSAYCDDGACPKFLDLHCIEFSSGTGGTCSDCGQYRNVLDYQGSCQAWKSAGNPLDPPAEIYCGHSLLYNWVNEGGQDIGGCGRCLAAKCPSQYAACNPSGGGGCDGLMRCLRGCAAGDDATAKMCKQQYSDNVDAANAYFACAVTSCRGICN